MVITKRMPSAVVQCRAGVRRVYKLQVLISEAALLLWRYTNKQLYCQLPQPPVERCKKKDYNFMISVHEQTIYLTLLSFIAIFCRWFFPFLRFFCLFLHFLCFSAFSVFDSTRDLTPRYLAFSFSLYFSPTVFSLFGSLGCSFPFASFNSPQNSKKGV